MWVQNSLGVFNLPIKIMQSRSFVCIRSYAFLFCNLVLVVVVMEAMNSYAFYVLHEVCLIMITVDVAHLTAHNIIWPVQEYIEMLRHELNRRVQGDPGQDN